MPYQWLLSFFCVFSIYVMLNHPVVAKSVGLTFKAKEQLSVCSYSEFKPIIYGDGKGYEADLLRAIAQYWHVSIRFYPEAVYEGIWRLPSRAYTYCDVAAGGMTPMDYRVKEHTVFSSITTNFTQSLLIRKQDDVSHRIEGYASFYHGGMKIGVVPGTTGELFAHQRARANGLPDAVFVQYPSESALLPALRAGKIDAIARGEIGNEYQAYLNPAFVTIAKQDFKEGFAFAVDQSNPVLLKKLNEAIAIVTDHGKISYLQWLHHHDVFTNRVKQLQQHENRE